MKEYVTDTHALLWYLFKNKRLSKRATSVFQKADEGEARVYVSNIVLVEIVYLLEKVKIPKESIDAVISLLEEPTLNYSLSQINISTIRALQLLPRNVIPDMPDRIIVATALELDLPVITRDRKIKEANVVKVIW